ncbi:hypothetical protein [Prescottella agglutinans]|uniref:Secreted protein n=1 Tax=Prescottella agglutinans TaxID=1644129 RepID=A0ABT6MHT1_9NOCA|nr:hypothetical protein [Prescottella agglutinans]MDH6282909.1 hypothetical protein [Prescottella agglutinans]
MEWQVVVFSFHPEFRPFGRMVLFVLGLRSSGLISPFQGVLMRKAFAAGLVAAASAGIVLAGTGVASAAPSTIPGMRGVYQVNVDVAPGTYKTQGTAYGAMQPCTWMRAKMTAGGGAIPLAVGQLTGPGEVTIESTDDIFLTAGCADWKRVGGGGSLDTGSLTGSLDAGSLGGSVDSGSLTGSLDTGSLTGSLTGSILGGANNGSSGSLAGGLLGSLYFR